MIANLPDVAAHPTASPELITQLGTSYRATRYLIAAVDVGVFEALGDDGLGLEALAARIAIPCAPPESAPTPWWRSACWNEMDPCTGTVRRPPRS